MAEKKSKLDEAVARLRDCAGWNDCPCKEELRTVLDALDPPEPAAPKKEPEIYGRVVLPYRGKGWNT